MYGRLALLCLEKGTEKNRSKEKRGCFRKIDYQRVALFLYRKSTLTPISIFKNDPVSIPYIAYVENKNIELLMSFY